MTSAVVSPEPASTRESVEWRASWPSWIFALTPLWVLIIATLASPTSFPPFGGEGPNLLGINLAVIVQGLALCGMLIGLRLAWNTTSRLVESLAYTVFTFPATMVVLFSPAIVVITQNRG